MRLTRLVLKVFVVCLVLPLHIGCQERANMVEKPDAPPTEHSPMLGPEIDVAGTQQPESAPGLVFEKETHDFGEVGPKAKNVCEFKFANSGDSLLKITKVRVSAPCCMRYTLKKKRYAPGESGVLKVSYDAGKYAGLVKKSIYISSSDKARPEITLTIQAKIVPRVTHRPKQVKLVLKGENAGCPEIVLTGADNQQFAVASFKSSGNCITASFDSSRKATKFVLVPKVDIGRLRSQLNGDIRIGLTHPECDEVTIPFSVLPEFEANPRSLVALNAEPQKPIKREIWILSNYREDFEIESVSSRKGVINVLSREKIGDRYKLALEIVPPPPDDGVRVFTDTLRVNIRGGEKLEINCHGVYARR